MGEHATRQPLLLNLLVGMNLKRQAQRAKF